MKISEKINSFKLKRQAGASLFEALMFIVIGALVVAGVIGLGTKVFSSNDEASAVQQVTEFAVNVKSTFAGQANFTGAAGTPASLHQVLISANMVPSGVSVAGTVFNNSYSGLVNVDGLGDTYSISYAGIPDAACLKIISKANQGWISITINGGTPNTVMPVPVATAQAQCIAGANTISWVGR